MNGICGHSVRLMSPFQGWESIRPLRRAMPYANESQGFALKAQVSPHSAGIRRGASHKQITGDSL